MSFLDTSQDIFVTFSNQNLSQTSSNMLYLEQSDVQSLNKNETINSQNIGQPAYAKEWVFDQCLNSSFKQEDENIIQNIEEFKRNINSTACHLNQSKGNNTNLLNSSQLSEVDFKSIQIGEESQRSIDDEENGYDYNQLLDKFDHISKNNISKNIIKAFFGYLLDAKENDLLSDFVSHGVFVSQARKMANNYFKSYNFNNNSLHKLIQHPKYGKAFEFYLTFEAEQWLADSKVKEKEAHFIYIDFLKLCCSDSNFSEHIVTYKKNKRSKFNERE